MLYKTKIAIRVKIKDSKDRAVNAEWVGPPTNYEKTIPPLGL